MVRGVPAGHAVLDSGTWRPNAREEIWPLFYWCARQGAFASLEPVAFKRASCFFGRTIMHMADALISPAVGGVMWVATAGLTAYSARKLTEEMDDRKIPLMGVLGALVFAAQMINFTIPGTGSSGHLGGAMLLAILLGPYAAFLTMASILTIQALFFADGGLLTLGCNVFNLGFFPCFIAFPLIYKRIAANSADRKRILPAALLASVTGLLLGALGVVVETFSSGISDLSFRTFVLLMLPIHLVIGIVEGFVTASVAGFVIKIRPEVLEASNSKQISIKPVLITLLIIAALTGGFLSWFASTNPEGLEWSVARSSGDKAPQGSSGPHTFSIVRIAGKNSLPSRLRLQERQG